MKIYKYTISLIILILGINISHAQSDSLKNFNSLPKFTISGGVLIPQNELKEYFGVSPLVELQLDFPFKHKKSVEASLQFAFPNQKESFTYLRSQDTVQAKATFLINFIVRYKRHLVKTKKSNLNINIGLGVSSIQTNARNPYYDGKDDQNKYESITSALFSSGIQYSYKFRYEEISIGFNIQVIPYKVEGALREKIGSVFFVPKISYRF